MANKKAILKQLADYFAEKGSVLNPSEYKAAEDAPIRYMVAKRPFGSWSRMTQMIKTNFPDQWANGHRVMLDTEELVTVRWEQVVAFLARRAYLLDAGVVPHRLH